MFALVSLLLYGVWGFSYKLLSAREIHGEWVVSLVMLLGAIISATIAVARSYPFPLEKVAGNIPWLLLVAASGALGNIVLLKAMSSPGISTGVALAVSGAYPLVAAVLAYYFLGEQIGGVQAVGILAVVLGVGLLTYK
ncbi:MAG: EamA family transporter [Pseudomonadota bacterium]